jgi:group I intron endonuclease
MYQIYIITNAINAKQYVGITDNLSRRWRMHKKATGTQAIHFAIQKHGVKNFVFSHVATVFDIEFAKSMEKMLIIEHNTKSPNGYNLTDGGDGVVGYKPSKEQKELRSALQKKKWQDPEYREAMTERFQLRWRNSDERMRQSARTKQFFDLQGKEYSSCHAEKIKTGWTEEKRKRQSLITSERQTQKDVKMSLSDSVKSLWFDPEYRARQSASRKAAWVIRKAKQSSEVGEKV